MILAQWRARRASKTLIEQIRGEIVTAARRPALYEVLGSPDRIDGRFELLTLHAGLVLRRLAALGGVADAIAQDLVDSLFSHFDDTLREIGHSDIGVSKRLKAMGSAFYGRNAAYAAALDDSSPAELATALPRNVYGATRPAHLPREGQVATIEANPTEREGLASFYRLPDIAALTATLRLEPWGRGG